MAFKKQAFILLLSLFTVSSIIHSSHADPCASSGNTISVNWGQVTAEGTLKEACDTNHYNIIILESLYLSDDGSTPYLNFAGHCGGEDDPCTKLESEIKHCQSKGIKVLLSIGGVIIPPSHRHFIATSEDVVNKVAEYLWDNFLSGQSGPLGSVALDGIDIISVAEGRNIHWDELVRAIHRITQERKIFLSAAPQCVYPDYFLDKAIRTGLFDHIRVKFFQNSPCEFSNGNSVNLVRAWEKWTSSVQASNLVFLAVPASPDAASSGYIPPDVLKSEILPTVKKSFNYGGVMIINRYFDKLTNYSGQINDGVPPKVCTLKCVCDETISGNFFGHLSH